MNQIDDAIGGYFALEPSAEAGSFEYTKGMLFQSARAALLAFLRARNPKRIWMPFYICDSLLGPVSAEFSVCLYHITEKFLPEEHIELESDDLLLFVNYFSICGDQVNNVIQRFSSNNVILDCSQAFYYKNNDCLASIYSPRKFFGVPDGGVLITDFPVTTPTNKDMGSQMRMPHLLTRALNGAEAGYAEFHVAEASLCAYEPLTMSGLTYDLLNKINYKEAKVRRNINFRFLYENFAHINKLKINIDKVEGASCYPLLIDDGHEMKARLIKNRIYVPTYWPDVCTRNCNKFEESLTTNLIALPSDQRYSLIEMERIIKCLT